MVPSSARTILDLGCSDGSLGAALKALVVDRKVWGIELSADLAARACNKLDQIKCGDLSAHETLNHLNGQSFDCIIAADVLEHLTAPEKLLKGLTRFLQPNGYLIVSLPNIRHHSALWSIYGKGTFPRRDRGIFDCTHLRWFTLRDARELMHQSGFMVEAESYSLRVGDKGGGIINKIADRLLSPIDRLAPIREFMTYQFVIRARLVKAET